MKKIALLAVITLLFCFSLTFFGCTIPDKKIDTDSYYSSWMKDLSDSTQLSDIAMPGSHDAVTDNMAFLSNQNTSVLNQLKSGVRYFEFRLSRFGNKLIFMHVLDNYFYKASDVFEDINKFISDNPSEFLIFNFIQFRKNSAQPTLDMLKEKLDVEHKAVLKTDNLKTMTMGNIREKGYNYLFLSDLVEADYIFNSSVVSSTFTRDSSMLEANKFIEQLDISAEKLNDDSIKISAAYLSADKVKRINSKKLDNTLKPLLLNYIKNITDEEIDNACIFSCDFTTSDMELIDSIILLNVKKGNMTLPAYFS